MLSDALFPHATHGFKGRNLPLVSFHVSPRQSTCPRPDRVDDLSGRPDRASQGCTLPTPLPLLQNPPWQIITSNGSGHVVEYKGLVFEIINELAKNLNFT